VAAEILNDMYRDMKSERKKKYVRSSSYYVQYTVADVHGRKT
jgi:hypothetical protein